MFIRHYELLETDMGMYMYVIIKFTGYVLLLSRRDRYKTLHCWKGCTLCYEAFHSSAVLAPFALRLIPFDCGVHQALVFLRLQYFFNNVLRGYVIFQKVFPAPPVLAKLWAIEHSMLQVPRSVTKFRTKRIIIQPESMKILSVTTTI